MESIRGALKLAFALDERRIRSRRLFDFAVLKAEKGKIVMYSCDVDESAAESPMGGLFSGSLIAGAKSWSEQQRSVATFSCWQAFQAAAEATTSASPQQHPQYRGGRRLWHFPFAVHVT
jgi:hypothetical protein